MMALKGRWHTEQLAGVAFVVALFVMLPCRAPAEGTLIPAPDRVDMVYDVARDTVYITSGNQVLRYHIGTNSFLSSYQLGFASTRLRGIDLSRDGNTLLVADGDYSEFNVWVHTVDLETGFRGRHIFPRSYYLYGGTFTVAFGNDGAALITSSFLGSGNVPLRRFHPGTGAWSEIATVKQDTMLAASGDGTCIGFAESNSSSGPFGWYDVAAGLLHRSAFQAGTGTYNYEMGVNNDGSQLAVLTYKAAEIYDAALNHMRTVGAGVGPSPIGVAYHPVDDIVYLAWSTTTEVRAHDTGTFAEIASYDFENYFNDPANNAFEEGRLKLARDGSLLFCSVDGGVRFVRLYPSLRAQDQSVTTPQDTPVAITLSATIGNGAPLEYSIVTLPQHGALTGVPPNVTYTPEPGYGGPDEFDFRAHYGQAHSNIATVSITIEPGNRPPIAVDDEATVRKGQTVVIDVLANDYDPDGDALTVTGVTQGSKGAVTVNPDDTVTYTAPEKFRGGTDTFTYSISDGHGGAATATVTIRKGGGGGGGGKGPKNPPPGHAR